MKLFVSDLIKAYFHDVAPTEKSSTYSLGLGSKKSREVKKSSIVSSVISK